MRRLTRSKLDEFERQNAHRLAAVAREQQEIANVLEVVDGTFSEWERNSPETFARVHDLDAAGELPEDEDSSDPGTPGGRIWSVLHLMQCDWEHGRPVAFPPEVLALCFSVPPGPAFVYGLHDCERCAYCPPIVEGTGYAPITGSVCPLCGGRVGYSAFRGDLRPLRRGDLGRRTRAALGMQP